MSRISISCCTLSSFQVGNHRLKCRNGAWSGQFPVCTGQFCQHCYKFVFRCIIQNIKIFSYSTSLSIKYSLFSSCRKMQSFTATTTQQWQGLTISIILLLYHLDLFWLCCLFLASCWSIVCNLAIFSRFVFTDMIHILIDHWSCEQLIIAKRQQMNVEISA